jgi:phosphoglycolate phosphatase
MKPRFDPVLFDLDGTLVDSGKDIANAVNHAIRGMGLGVLPDDELLGYVGDGVRRLMEQTLGRLGRTDVDEQIQVFRAYYREHHLDHTRPYPGIRDLLADLSSVRVGIVTNKPGYFARMITEGLDLDSRIGTLIGGDETELIKPHPDPLLAACTQLGADPKGGIMVGDYSNDVQAGRAAGMATCGVLWGFAGTRAVTEAGPDHLVADIHELREVLFSR